MLSKLLAYDIAVAFEEIEKAEKLLAEIDKEVELQKTRDRPQMRDAFGRVVNGLQLGIPSGNGHRLFNLEWSLAKPVIRAHIAHTQARLEALQLEAAASFTRARDEALKERGKCG